MAVRRDEKICRFQQSTLAVLLTMCIRVVITSHDWNKGRRWLRKISNSTILFTYHKSAGRTIWELNATVSISALARHDHYFGVYYGRDNTCHGILRIHSTQMRAYEATGERASAESWRRLLYAHCVRCGRWVCERISSVSHSLMAYTRWLTR